MRSSPDLRVRISAPAGRSCTGAPWGPCSSQSGAAAVGLSSVSQAVLQGLKVSTFEGFIRMGKESRRAKLNDKKDRESEVQCQLQDFLPLSKPTWP